MDTPRQNPPRQPVHDGRQDWAGSAAQPLLGVPCAVAAHDHEAGLIEVAAQRRR
jgi:hypothetical protein